MRILSFTLSFLLFPLVSGSWATPTKKRIADAAYVDKVASSLFYRHLRIKEAITSMQKDPRLPDALKQITLSSKYRTIQRIRAMWGLQYISKTVAKTAYIKLLQQPKLKQVLLRNALNAFQIHFKKEALPYALKHLKNQDVTIREVAIDIIQKHPSVQGLQQLTLHLKVEKSKFLLRRGHLALKTLQLWKRTQPTLKKPHIKKPTPKKQK